MKKLNLSVLDRCRAADLGNACVWVGDGSVRDALRGGFHGLWERGNRIQGAYCEHGQCWIDKARED